MLHFLTNHKERYKPSGEDLKKSILILWALLYTRHLWPWGPNVPGKLQTSLWMNFYMEKIHGWYFDNIRTSTKAEFEKCVHTMNQIRQAIKFTHENM